MSRESILDDIRVERGRQDELFPNQEPGWSGAPGDYEMLAVLVEEVGEVAKASMEGVTKDLQRELVEVAAVAVKWLEIIDYDPVGRS